MDRCPTQSATAEAQRTERSELACCKQPVGQCREDTGNTDGVNHPPPIPWVFMRKPSVTLHPMKVLIADLRF